MKKILITHIQLPEEKSLGVYQLRYFHKSEEKYYHNKENNSFEKSQIDLWAKDKKIYELKEHVIITEDKTLYMDEDNLIYIHHMQNMDYDKEIGKLENLVL